MPAFAAERPPLPTLLSQLLFAFTIEFDDGDEAPPLSHGLAPHPGGRRGDGS